MSSTAEDLGRRAAEQIDGGDPWPTRSGWDHDVKPADELIAAIDRLEPAEQRRALAYLAQDCHDQQGATPLTKLCPEFLRTWMWPGRKALDDR